MKIIKDKKTIPNSVSGFTPTPKLMSLCRVYNEII